MKICTFFARGDSMKLNASKNLSVFVYSAFLLFSACGGGNGYGGGANTGGTLP
jgi:hypothetical protein